MRLSLQIVGLLFSTALWATEGFHLANQSPLPANTWESVLGLRGNHGPSEAFGSVVVVQIEEQSVRALTVAHNLEDTKNLAAFDFYSKPFSDSIQILKMDKENDLALVRIHIPSDQLANLRAARLPNLCQMDYKEKLFAVGYPATDLREWKQVGIERYDEVLKRWSQGVFTEDALASKTSASYDCMHGCSGGGVFNAKGELVGIHQESLVSPGYPYLGSDSLAQAHSFFISCETIRSFLYSYDGGYRPLD